MMIGLISLTLFLSSGMALAWYWGPFIPPPFWVGPPAFYYGGYYPPPAYYGPGYYPGYYYGPPRVWVPATGKADGSLTGGKGFGSPGTGDIADRTKRIERLTARSNVRRQTTVFGQYGM